MLIIRLASWKDSKLAILSFYETSEFPDEESIKYSLWRNFINLLKRLGFRNTFIWRISFPDLYQKNEQNHLVTTRPKWYLNRKKITFSCIKVLRIILEQLLILYQKQKYTFFSLCLLFLSMETYFAIYLSNLIYLKKPRIESSLKETLLIQRE